MDTAPELEDEFVGLNVFLLVKCHPFYPDNSHHRKITTRASETEPGEDNVLYIILGKL